jgi:glycosidase
MTARGIPQILYGSEIGMMGGESHVKLRADFPGGFPGHQKNAFTSVGRDATQTEMFDFFRSLFQLRKQHPALTRGKMVHFAPTWNNDTYKILKIHETEKILLIANGNAKTVSVDLGELKHHLTSTKKLRDLQSNQEMTWTNGTKVEVPGMTARLYLLVE